MTRHLLAFAIVAMLPHTIAWADVTLEYNTGAPYLSPFAALPGTQVSIPYYDEDGFRSKPLGPIRTTPPYNLALAGPDTDLFAGNGSAHLSLLNGNNLEVFHLGGSSFDVIQVDLAEYSIVFPVPKTVVFEGLRANGAMVTTSFTTDGVIFGGNSTTDFETFTFPAEFTDLLVLKTTTDRFSLDNLVLVVPEPNGAWLPFAGLLILTGRYKSRN